ncbi:ABC transporter ATP-binding protein [Nannocystis radixulma]|uniref:ABC transporter ATP-binding protein n=1 Tax=Nannocystis radixulma TaxID=2995305 RepID=A0ABT5B0E1_9BACT|nr:ABC transporter ATP-binding protein [Nannocystis radixulma]MDC0667569.1 ABC transporter ATP-binding protein [Nannocystis radixulma]
MTRAPASLAVDHLSHRYPGAAAPALRDVSFRVAPGQRVGLLGPNGAGKSTLMRIVCGFLPVQARPETKVTVAGLDATSQSLQVREQVGYLPEQVPLYVELRVREHLDFRAAIKRVPRRARATEIRRVAEQTGLAEMLERPIAHLSRGYRQRVGIADALLGAPPLVILDEPTVGLDPNQVLEIRAMLKSLGGGQTLIFSSHILAEVEALCDRVVVLAQGRCVADESVAEALRTSEVHARWEGPPERATAVLAAAGAEPARVEGPVADGGTARATIRCADAGEAEALAAAIGRASLAAGLPTVRLEIGRRSLEERFYRLTSGEAVPESMSEGRGAA